LFKEIPQMADVFTRRSRAFRLSDAELVQPWHVAAMADDDEEWEDEDLEEDDLDEDEDWDEDWDDDDDLDDDEDWEDDLDEEDFDDDEV
jgi:hypothetical protein